MPLFSHLSVRLRLIFSSRHPLHNHQLLGSGVSIALRLKSFLLSLFISSVFHPSLPLHSPYQFLNGLPTPFAVFLVGPAATSSLSLPPSIPIVFLPSLSQPSTPPFHRHFSHVPSSHSPPIPQHFLLPLLRCVIFSIQSPLTVLCLSIVIPQSYPDFHLFILLAPVFTSPSVPSLSRYHFSFSLSSVLPVSQRPPNAFRRLSRRVFPSVALIHFHIPAFKSSSSFSYSSQVLFVLVHFPLSCPHFPSLRRLHFSVIFHTFLVPILLQFRSTVSSQFFLGSLRNSFASLQSHFCQTSSHPFIQTSTPQSSTSRFRCFLRRLSQVLPAFTSPFLFLPFYQFLVGLSPSFSSVPPRQVLYRRRFLSSFPHSFHASIPFPRHSPFSQFHSTSAFQIFLLSFGDSFASLSISFPSFSNLFFILISTPQPSTPWFRCFIRRPSKVFPLSLLTSNLFRSSVLLRFSPPVFHRPSAAFPSSPSSPYRCRLQSSSPIALPVTIPVLFLPIFRPGSICSRPFPTCSPYRCRFQSFSPIAPACHDSSIFYSHFPPALPFSSLLRRVLFHHPFQTPFPAFLRSPKIPCPCHLLCRSFGSSSVQSAPCRT